LFLPELIAAPVGSGSVRCARGDDLVTICIAMVAPTAPCPECGNDALRVHSRYTRRLADLPCLGIPVRLELTVRRFRCSNPDCPRRIFAERLPGFAAPYARATDRLRRSQEAIGHALGGAAGSRLTVRLAMVAGGETLLRRVKQRPCAPIPAPRCVGIDDWAWRKGKSYGTIVVDLERGEVIDLLPDRETATATEWFRARSSVELVSRDRSAGYAQAATEGAARGRQVADRWHLLKNMREAVERLFERHHKAVAEALRAVEAPPEAPNLSTSVSTGAKPTPEDVAHASPEAVQSTSSSRREVQRIKRSKRAERFTQVHNRRRKHHSIRRIARELGMSPRTVGRYLRYEQYPACNTESHNPPRSTVIATGSTPASPRASRMSWRCIGK
jgi:transposase